MCSGIELLILGVAQDGGLPHLGCNAACCAHAKQSGRVETPACIAIGNADTGGVLLLEATPSIVSQVNSIDLLWPWHSGSGSFVNAIAITHAHIGHYTGLMHLGREGAATDNMPVHVSSAVANVLRTNAPWSNLVDEGHVSLFEFHAGEQEEPVQGIRIEPLTVEHRNELADTVAFKVHGPHRTALFCPDIDQWGNALERLLDGVDIALLDGTFYDESELPGRDRAVIGHPTIVDTMERIEAMGASRPADVRFIHLNHSNAVFHAGAAADDVNARGFRVAKAGDRISL
jgi:pyrroloquinoline quinone biosynthesis protein B